jgi:hypothetical protein
MRAEWREEQEAATRDAAEDWVHRQTIEDRLRAHMHRGDTLAMVVAGQRFVGEAEEVGATLVALRTAAGRVDIHLAPSVPFRFSVARRATVGGHRGSDVAGGRFRAALLARERDARVRIGTLHDPDGVAGSVVVSADHVLVTGPEHDETVIPITDVAWIAPDA